MGRHVGGAGNEATSADQPSSTSGGARRDSRRAPTLAELILPARLQGDRSRGGSQGTFRSILITSILSPMLPMVVLYLTGLSGGLFATCILLLLLVGCSAMFFGGLHLLGKSGYGQRVGDTVHCSQCEYQLGPNHEDYERCSECGNDVTQPDSTVVGLPRVQPRRIVIGAALVGSGLYSAYCVMFIPPWLKQNLPTSVVGVYATGFHGSMNSSLWNELAARPMTKAQRDRMAGRLLTERHQGRLSNTAKQWLDSAVLSETVSAGIVDRYFDGAYDFYLEFPDEVELGESMRVNLSSHLYEPTWTSVQPHIVVQVHRFNGHESACCHDTAVALFGVGRSRWTSSIYEQLCSMGFTYETDDPFFQLGEYDIGVRFWVLYAPSQDGEYDIEWNGDGTPIPPPGTVWMGSYEVDGSTRIVAPLDT